MIRLLLILMMGIALAAAEPASGTLQGSGPGAATAKDGVIEAKARGGTDTVTYFSFRCPFSGDLTGRMLHFSAETETPELTKGFYVRGYNAANECLLSYMSWSGLLGSRPREFVLVPGSNSAGMSWERSLVKADAADRKLAYLVFYIGIRGNEGQEFGVRLTDIRLDEIPVVNNAPPTGFKLLGVGARSAELRSLVAGRDAAGKRFILVRPEDNGKRGYLLYTDLETGVTTQYFNPENVIQGDNFGSVLSSKGKFYYDQTGGNVLVFDVNTRRTEFLGRPDPETVHFMVYTEAPDGTILLGGYPRSTVTAFSPVTGKFRNYGRMDDQELYLSTLATDKNGYIYCGIGSARANIVALDPGSGKIIPLLPEDKRKLGYGNVLSGADGYAYADFGDFRVKLLDGKIVAENVAKFPAPRPVAAPKYGGRVNDFDDGLKVISYDLCKRRIGLVERDGKKRELSFDYVSGGLGFTSIGAGPDGKLYGSTSHPMHFVEFDSASGKITDHGPNPIVRGGNLCNIAGSAEKVYACEYAGGRLWEYDPSKPVCFQSAGISGFGPPPAELASSIRAEGGRYSVLQMPPVLFCRGDRDGATFTLPFTVGKPGKYYFNCIFFEHLYYGAVTVTFQGRRIERDLQSKVDRSSPTFSLGPFELAAGTYQAVFTARAKQPGTHPWFGIVSAELASAPRPATAAAAGDDNPRILGRWEDLVTRPRAVNVHPDGKHVVISGFANYGLTGGGFGIHNLADGTNREIADWLPGHSCIAFRFLPGGDIVGGTSIDAPGGGHRKVEDAVLFRLDWPTGKVVKTLPLPGVTNVVSVELWQGKLFAVTADARLYVIDPKTFAVELKDTLSGTGQPPRNALQLGADGRLFVLQSGSISEFNPKSLRPEVLANTPTPITTGGACVNGKLYFGCGNEWAEYQYPAKK